MSTGNAPTQTAPNQSDLSVPSEVVPALTILWHPDLSRVGAMFSFGDMAEGSSLLLSRNSPEFGVHAEHPRALEDPFLSRQPFLQLTRAAEGVEVAPGTAKCTISRTTLYDHIQRDPELHKASDIPDDELQRLKHECQGDLDRLSKRLRVSGRALKLRLARST